jgi:hypothetical protein
VYYSLHVIFPFILSITLLSTSLLKVSIYSLNLSFISDRLPCVLPDSIAFHCKSSVFLLQCPTVLAWSYNIN